MDLRHLRYFQAVAEELSFSKAARKLRIAQPALSRTVQELELELGCRLMDRDRRSVRLTPAGSTLLEETGLLLDRLEESLRRVRRAASGEDGELRLGYIGPPTRPFLGPLLLEYRSRFPRITVILEERTPERVWEMVSRGRLSIGLTRPVIAHEALDLKSLTLREETLCAVVPAQHPFAQESSLPWEKLANQPIILLARREGAGSHDTILAACQKAGFTPRIAHTPSLIGTILQYTEAGAGIGIVPESVLPLDPSLKLLPLTPRQTIPLVMVWSKDGDDPAVIAFRSLIESHLQAQTLWPLPDSVTH
jgi:LysR family transcriptional regulator, benzoate and cis,cis-muconate-responsive activator of ben and cat genes